MIKVSLTKKFLAIKIYEGGKRHANTNNGRLYRSDL